MLIIGTEIVKDEAFGIGIGDGGRGPCGPFGEKKRRGPKIGTSKGSDQDVSAGDEPLGN
jgi:hypothetical protein